MVTVFVCYHRALAGKRCVWKVLPRQKRLDEASCRRRKPSLEVQLQSKLDLSRIVGSVTS
jgi:hypothetical protein